MNNIKKALLYAFVGVLLITNIQSSPAQVVDPNPAGTTPYCLQLNNDIGYRSTDAQTNGEVSDLQDFLNVNGYLSVQPTGYYGLITTSAVTKFQSTANGFSSSSGFVGPYTRAKISEITCASTYSPGTQTNTSTTTTTTTTTNSYPDGCNSNSGFSATTGKSCSASNYPDGCTSEKGYSSTTGRSCSPYPAGCTSNNGYSSTTGKSCSGETYPSGCSSNSGYSSTTGNRCDGTATDPQPTYPSGCDSDSGYSSTTGKRCDGSSTPPPAPAPAPTTDPVLQTVSPNSGSIVNTRLTLNGSNFNVGYNTVYFNKSNGSYSSISVTSADGRTINFNPCDNRTTSDCQRLENDLSPKFQILVQRVDGRKSDTVDFTVKAYPPGCTSNSDWSTTTGAPCDVTQPYATINSPNGGENWQVGSTHDITWSYSGPSDTTVSIQLIAGDSGAGYIANNVRANLQRYSWTIPSNMVPGTYFRIAIRDTSHPNDSLDFSDSEFTISSAQSPSITVHAPGNGDYWQAGTTRDIIWQYWGPSDLLVDIKLGRDGMGGAAASTIATGVRANLGRYSWTIPSNITPASDYMILFNPTSSIDLTTTTSVFTISSAPVTTSNTHPVINSFPTVPSTVNVNQVVHFNWGATDADGDDLSWSASFGDQTGSNSTTCLTSPQDRRGWTFNTSHAWASPGTYTVIATVYDCRGGLEVADEHSFTVTVGTNATAPNAPRLSISSTEQGIELSWLIPTDNGGSPITGFKIYRSESTESNTTTPTVIATTANASILVSPPPDNTTYSYWATAMNSAGESVFSNGVSVSRSGNTITTAQ